VSSLSLLAACFVAGVASVVSPCILPLVPVYLVAAAASTRGRPQPPGTRLTVGLAGARFVAGFVVVFVGLGAFSGATASLLPAPAQARVAGLVLVAVGMVGLGLLPAPPVGRLVPAAAAIRGPVVLGAAFALAATPCTTPLLGVGLAAALSGATAGRGALVLAAYGAGIATAMVAVGGATGRAAAGVVRTRSGLVMHLAAVATLAFGVVLALGQEWRFSVAVGHVLDRAG
jgi:cytochrome c-type biogenesis protein